MPFKDDGTNHMARVIIPKTTWDKLTVLAAKLTTERGRQVHASDLIRSGVRMVLARGGVPVDERD